MIIKDVANACVERQFIFSLGNIIEATGLERLQVRRALEKLEREGHLRRVGETEKPLPGFSKGRPNKEPRFIPTRSLKKRVAVLNDKRQTEVVWDTIWRAVRHMRRFTRRDLVIVTGASFENVRYFTKRLRAAGYIKSLEKGNWALIKDPGPKRPCTNREA